MRRRRIKRDGLAYYHCMTRVVGRQMLLGEAEKEYMRLLIRRVEGFTGVRVMTYAVMTNHIHLLLEEPDRGTVVDDEELLGRMQSLYSGEEMAEIEARWMDWLVRGHDAAVLADKMRYRRRMHDISEFMKTLKHRFSFWYNRLHDRKGTLWSERFKSVLVEGGEALCTVAAYIEMNPVRAGIVIEPAAYRFCGFGEAVEGSPIARRGIMDILAQKGLAFGVERSRRWPDVKGYYSESILLYRLSKGDVFPSQQLLCRCRYFTDGQVLGSRSFVEAFFEEHRDYFGPRRRMGGRKVKGEWPSMYAIRDVGHTVSLNG
ncbi:MAG: transposase [Spartobacteria bacterium]|nr:transposase [Spartobacteria bacterium]